MPVVAQHPAPSTDENRSTACRAALPETDVGGGGADSCAGNTDLLPEHGARALPASWGCSPGLPLPGEEVWGGVRGEAPEGADWPSQPHSWAGLLLGTLLSLTPRIRGKVLVYQSLVGLTSLLQAGPVLPCRNHLGSVCQRNSRASSFPTAVPSQGEDRVLVVM